MLVFFNKIQEVTMLIMVIRNKTPTYFFLLTYSDKIRKELRFDSEKNEHTN